MKTITKSYIQKGQRSANSSEEDYVHLEQQSSFSLSAENIQSFVVDGVVVIGSIYYPWENQNSRTNYLTSPEPIEQISVVHNFAQKLIQNLKPLDPSIAKVVDDHFWELLS